MNVSWIKSPLLLSLLLSSGVLLSGCTDDNQTTVTARLDNFNVAVRANGELASADTIFLTPPSVNQMWRYKLNFMATEGSMVEKGDVVARFETNTLTDKLRQKQDELGTESKELENLVLKQEKEKEDIKVQLARREVDLRKAKRKTEQVDQTTSVVESQKLLLDLQIAEHDLALYQEKVERLVVKHALALSIGKRQQQSLQAEVDKLKLDIKKLSVKAPKAGLFVYANNFEGNKFVVGDTLHTGQSYAEIPSLEKMIVKAQISERNLGQVKIGMKVEIVLDANPQVKYLGHLVELGAVISEKAKNNPEKVIEAQISIEQPDHQIMRPGMIARLSIVVDTYNDVIVIPTQAVQIRNGQATVQMKSSFGQWVREVTVVAFDEQTTAISAGLEVGEQVLL